MKVPWGKMILVILLLFVAIQFVPVGGDNPPVEQDIPTSVEVKAILKRACYDCHSNETIWPWYGQVAPLSWLLAWDVREGRKELNYSTWNRYDAEERGEIVHESWEEVQEGEMPPWFYLPLHPEARISEKDQKVLRVWAASVPSESDDESEHDDD